MDQRGIQPGGKPARKASQTTLETDQIKVLEAVDYVSRAGHKLARALDVFSQIELVDRVALDVGASTGGFTDVLLRRGAKKVIAVDVGYGQLAWSLQSDPRVEIHDRTNVRNLSRQLIVDEPMLIVADLSFISLNLVLPALMEVAHPEADFLIMVKPQFEVGREKLGAGGVVREPELRAEAVKNVAESARSVGLGTLGVVASPLPGPSGNVEYFLWMRQGNEMIPLERILEAVSKGPQ